MTDPLDVQRDDVARRVVLDGTDLTPAQAIDLGEQLIRAGRELQTEQVTLDDVDQLVFAEGPDGLGTPAADNPNDPLEW